MLDENTITRARVAALAADMESWLLHVDPDQDDDDEDDFDDFERWQYTKMVDLLAELSELTARS